MKHILIITAFIILISVSCNKSPAQKSVKTHPPKVTKTVATDISFSGTRGDNIVDDIYNQLVDKNPVLKELETQISRVGDAKSDSAKAFDDFNNSNNAYYTGATAYAADIKDSVLRVTVKNIIAQSQTAYSSNTTQFKHLKNLIGDKSEALNNLHIMLKLLKTMAAMEQYQNTAMPALKPLQNVLAGYNAAIATTQQLAKK